MCTMMAAGEVDWHGGLTSVRQDECRQKVSHNHVTSQKTGSKTHRYVTSQRGGQKNTITWHHRKLGQNPQTCDITERGVKNPQSHDIAVKGVKNPQTRDITEGGSKTHNHVTSWRGGQKVIVTPHYVIKLLMAPPWCGLHPKSMGWFLGSHKPWFTPFQCKYDENTTANMGSRPLPIKVQIWNII